MATRRKTARKPASRAQLKGAKPSKPAGRREIVSANAATRTGVLEIRNKFGVNRQVFSRLAQFSERAIAKWEAGEPLSAPSQQRMAELRRLQQALGRVMQVDFVAEWLQTPNEAFGGLKPLEVVERGEVDRIWRMIYLLESGVPG